MATCPECDAEIEVDEFDVDKGIDQLPGLRLESRSDRSVAPSSSKWPTTRTRTTRTTTRSAMTTTTMSNDDDDDDDDDEDKETEGLDE